MDWRTAYRTGQILHMRREVARGVFNVPIPDELEMCFIDPEATAKIKGMMPGEGEGEGEGAAQAG